MPTATLLSEFSAASADSGIEVRWRFQEPGSATQVTVERALSDRGPWSNMEVVRREEGGVEVGLDRSVEFGKAYWYRIAASVSGARFVSWVVQATARDVIREFALAPPRPNPMATIAEVGFALPRDTRVDLSVFDMQGRRVATLVNGMVPAGRHTTSWNTTAGSRRIAAGIYFVHLQAPGVKLSRPMVVVR